MQAICRISRQAVEHNFSYFQRLTAGRIIIPVVKANAYGHDASLIVNWLTEIGVRLFAVATPEEAAELAPAYPNCRFLIFSRTFPDQLSLLPPNVILTVTSTDDIVTLAKASHRLEAHINLNTGMNRLGVNPEEALTLLKNPPHNVRITGLYSHFATADEEGPFFHKQRELFAEVVEEVRRQGFSGMIHIANSAATLREADTHYDGVRIGISLYGYDTTPEQKHQAELLPVMEVYAPLVRVARLKAGEAVSYGRTWQAANETNLGTLRFGYADGYNRHLSNRGQVAFKGRYFPVVGTVTMDHIMVDLGGETFPTGSYFLVLGGRRGPAAIANVARLLETIPYEICCAISGRVPRIPA